MDVDEEIRKFIISTAAGASVYYPMDMATFYCTIDEYENEKNSDKIKVHYPVIHRYYNAGWCINTDGIGKRLNARHLSYQDPAPCDYPQELIQRVDFPLYIGAGDYWSTEKSGFWDNGFGNFVYEKFIISFSLTRKTMHFYRIFAKLNEEKVKFKAEQLLLPPYPVVITDRAWQGEEDGEYTLEDLKRDLIEAVMRYEPSFSAVELEQGKDKRYEKRREKIISLIEKKVMESE